MANPELHNYIQALLAKGHTSVDILGMLKGAVNEAEIIGELWSLGAPVPQPGEDPSQLGRFAKLRPASTPSVSPTLPAASLNTANQLVIPNAKPVSNLTRWFTPSLFGIGASIVLVMQTFFWWQRAINAQLPNYPWLSAYSLAFGFTGVWFFYLAITMLDSSRKGHRLSWKSGMFLPFLLLTAQAVWQVEVPVFAQTISLGDVSQYLVSLVFHTLQPELFLGVGSAVFFLLLHGQYEEVYRPLGRLRVVTLLLGGTLIIAPICIRLLFLL